MKPTHVYAVHPAGYLVEFALDEGEHLADAVEVLVEREYRPSHGDAWPRTPDGLPICPKHGEVMAQREKQGDTWFSHKVTDAAGEVLFCRGYPGKSSPGWEVPARRRVGGPTPQQQQPPAQTQRPPAPQQPAPAARPAAPGVGAPTEQAPAEPQGLVLPDYRQLAIDAKAAGEFDYAAYMVLRNGVYDSVERVAKTRQSLVPDWTPTPATNEAMLLCLEVYRDKRAEAQGRGTAAAEAHIFAKMEALRAYSATIS